MTYLLTIKPSNNAKFRIPRAGKKYEVISKIEFLKSKTLFVFEHLNSILPETKETISGMAGYTLPHISDSLNCENINIEFSNAISLNGFSGLFELSYSGPMEFIPKKIVGAVFIICEKFVSLFLSQKFTESPLIFSKYWFLKVYQGIISINPPIRSTRINFKLETLKDLINKNVIKVRSVPIKIIILRDVIKIAENNTASNRNKFLFFEIMIFKTKMKTNKTEQIKKFCCKIIFAYPIVKNIVNNRLKIIGDFLKLNHFHKK
jgi:hypothetical protein